MHIFYIPHISGQTVTLTEEESKHCIRVLRMNQGDEFRAIDGKGNFLHCRITDPHPKRCTAEIIEIEEEFGKRPFRLHIAIAPTKNIDRFEWFLEKATEIGVDEITPLLCEHSERKNINHERSERVIIAAMKQSVKAYLPKLNQLTKLDTVLSQAVEQKKLIAYCGEFNQPNLTSIVNKGESLLILIGPEGDFSPNEVENAISNGFSTVGLGKSRLRTETAGVVACTIANSFNEM